MIAVDTNVLVYAHRAESRWHEAARHRLENLAGEQAPWGIPVFCVGEFLRVVTHRRVFDPPSTPEDAWIFLDGLLASPSARVLLPSERFAPLLRQVVQNSGATGSKVFDAVIAAVCVEAGADVILTQDRDFASFAGVKALRLP